MIEQTSENSPLVNIVMATYNPRLDWFEEQLQTLNNQTYPNIKLLVMDDCSTEVEIEIIKEYIDQNITNFPYELYQNEVNLGSNKTFEELTQMADGEYIAYCDQDDVWLAEKIEKLVGLIQKTSSTLVCSDVYVIDEVGKIKTNSITEARKRHIFKEGENLSNDLLFRNFVIGCTMLMPAEIAKEAIPFIEDMVHDHYLALYAAMKGRIGVYKDNLINYRIHENNQTNILSGVETKKDYYDIRINPYLNRMEQIIDRFDVPKVKEVYEWAKAREGYYLKKSGCGKILWKLRELDKNTTVFELIMLKMPTLVFKATLRWIQGGKI